jgi:hypothetical protein
LRSVTRSDNIPRPRPERQRLREVSGWTHPVIRQVIEDPLCLRPRTVRRTSWPGGDQPSTQPQRPATAIWLASWCTELHSPSARAGANAFGIVVSGDYVFVAYSELREFPTVKGIIPIYRRIYPLDPVLTVYTFVVPNVPDGSTPCIEQAVRP